MLYGKNQNLGGFCLSYCYGVNFVQIQNNDSTQVYFTFKFCLSEMKPLNLPFL